MNYLNYMQRMLILLVLIMPYACMEGEKKHINSVINNPSQNGIIYYNEKINTEIIKTVKSYIDTNQIHGIAVNVVYLEFFKSCGDTTSFILTSLKDDKVIRDGKCDGIAYIDSVHFLLLDVVPSYFLSKDKIFSKKLMNRLSNYLTHDTIPSIYDPLLWEISFYGDTAVVDKLYGSHQEVLKAIYPKEKFTPPVVK